MLAYITRNVKYIILIGLIYEGISSEWNNIFKYLPNNKLTTLGTYDYKI